MVEKKIVKGLQIVTALLTLIFIALSYGAYDPVAWAAATGMAIATLILLLFVPEL